MAGELDRHSRETRSELCVTCSECALFSPGILQTQVNTKWKAKAVFFSQHVTSRVNKPRKEKNTIKVRVINLGETREKEKINSLVENFDCQYDHIFKTYFFQVYN